MPHDHRFLPQELIVAVEWTITIEGKNDSATQSHASCP